MADNRERLAVVSSGWGLAGTPIKSRAAVSRCPELPPFLGLKIVVSAVRFCPSPPSIKHLIKEHLLFALATAFEEHQSAWGHTGVSAWRRPSRSSPHPSCSPVGRLRLRLHARGFLRADVIARRPLGREGDPSPGEESSFVISRSSVQT